MNTTTERDPLDLVAEEFAERCRRGDTPSVTDFAAKYPDLADDLRELLPAVAQMEMLKRHRHSSTQPTTAHVSDCPAKLGDYRIVRELGRGGMGIVYEAVQESLGRRVALKMLPLPGRNDAVRRERFLREAQVAARLHHTNIVPVFGVGEENGVPYFVMQFIPGCGLNDVISNWRSLDSDVKNFTKSIVRPNEWRRIAEIGLAAANALEYAHDQGVLHRDVKPGNLLLDHHGAVWIADFGLAKLTDHQTLTATGDLLGTIPYMAPEALRGHADARTDIYGLGMTLYELATGSMPFDQSNPAILIREIGEKEPPTPRSRNPKVPRDLETIILKAIAREPGHRYASAVEMEDDLDAFLNDQPIRARRSSILQRNWLWAKRNPYMAMLASITAGALIFSAIFGWVSYSRTNAALASERKLLQDAKEANEKLLDNLNLSLAAFESVFEAAGGPEPFAFGGGPPPMRPDGDGPRGPRQEGDGSRNPMRTGGPDGEGRGPRPNAMGPVGPRQSVDPAAMLEAVLNFYEKFAEQNAANPKLQKENATSFNLRLNAAKAYRKVGQVNLFLGRPDKAGLALRRSIEMIDELIRQYPDKVEVQREFINAVASLEMRIEHRSMTGDRVTIRVEHRFSSGERLELVRKAINFVEDGLAVPVPLLYMLWSMAKADDGDKQLAETIRPRLGDYRPPPDFRFQEFRPPGERPMGRAGEPGPRRQ